MIKKIVVSIVILSLLNLLAGCVVSKTEQRYGSEIPKSTERIVQVVLKNGDTIDFGRDGGKYISSKNVVYGTNTENRYIEVPLSDILYVNIKRVDYGASIAATILGTALVFAAIMVIVALTKESCPFVYTFDGEQYIFDAEPLGGAITKGLEQTDLSRLDHLKAVNGEYRLLFRNEVEETQYLDKVSLIITDHEPGYKVVADWDGVLHKIRQPVLPFTALDENGNDLMKFIQRSDAVAWQTDMPRDHSYKTGDLRHRLTFEFEKPPDAKQAQLLVNIGTTPWGSRMIRELLELQGDRVHEWYEGVDGGGPQLERLRYMSDREEHFRLKILVEEEGLWVERGSIPGSGPLIIEDRIIHLDLHSITSDTLRIRLQPPKGFWIIDHIALAYDYFEPPGWTESAIAHATDHTGRDIKELLLYADDDYHIMPQVGDWFTLSFEVPPQEEGTKRTIFLNTTGYYVIHLDGTRVWQPDIIQEIANRPGYIIEYALDLYIDWYHRMAEKYNQYRLD